MNRKQRLEDLEKTITTFKEHRRKAAKALWKISEEDLYEERGYPDVKTYAAGHFGFTRKRGEQLVNFGHVIDILEGEGNGTPQNEAQARPLGYLLGTDEEDDIPDIWELVTDRYGLSHVTMLKVREAVHDFLESADDDTDEDDEDEPTESEVNLHVPPNTADKLGLDGQIHRGRRIVPADGLTRSDLREIVEQTEPNTAPLDAGEEDEIGSMVWRPLRGDEPTKRLQTAPPSNLQFRPDDVQRIRESYVPQDHNRDHFRATESSDALACPEVDLLSDDVPDSMTKEILDWSGGGDWNPIFVSSHPGRWTDHPLPDEGWIGARADRSSIEETTGALESADDSEVKWALYDLEGDDRREGLPDVDLSPLDWLVIDRISSDLPIDQLRLIRSSIEEHDIPIAVRGDFTTSLRDKPSA